MTTNATTTAAHAIGVIRFELPLRGESLAAWLNSVFTGICRIFIGKPRAPCPIAMRLRDHRHAGMAQAVPH